MSQSGGRHQTGPISAAPAKEDPMGSDRGPQPSQTKRQARNACRDGDTVAFLRTWAKTVDSARPSNAPLLRALEVARRARVSLPQRYRLLAYQAVAAYEAIHGVSCVASLPGLADCLT